MQTSCHGVYQAGRGSGQLPRASPASDVLLLRQHKHMLGLPWLCGTDSHQADLGNHTGDELQDTFLGHCHYASLPPATPALPQTSNAHFYV